MLGTAATFSAGAIVITLLEIFQHIHYYCRPVLQKQIVRLLALVPSKRTPYRNALSYTALVYASCSLLSLAFPGAGKWLEVVREARLLCASSACANSPRLSSAMRR